MQLHLTADNPAPPGAVCQSVASTGGVYVRAMYALVDNPRGTVVLMGGRGDFMERYFETMRDLMALGFAVASFDFRGQGGSDRLLDDTRRGHIRDFRHLEEDLESVMSAIVEPYCPAPYYGLGHSTGGGVLLLALRHMKSFQRAAVIAPLVGLDYQGWPRPLVWALVTLFNGLGLGWTFLPGYRRGPLGRKDFPGNPLTSYQTRWDRDSGILEENPALGTGGPTFAWLKAARRGTKALAALSQKYHLTCPVMIVAAGKERVVSMDAMRRFAARVPHVSLVVIRESLHEVLAETDEVRNQFLAAFDAFIRAGEDEN